MNDRNSNEGFEDSHIKVKEERSKKKGQRIKVKE